MPWGSGPPSLRSPIPDLANAFYRRGLKDRESRLGLRLLDVALG